MNFKDLSVLLDQCYFDEKLFTELFHSFVSLKLDIMDEYHNQSERSSFFYRRLIRNVILKQNSVYIPNLNSFLKEVNENIDQIEVLLLDEIYRILIPNYYGQFYKQPIFIQIHNFINCFPQDKIIEDKLKSYLINDRNILDLMCFIIKEKKSKTNT